MKPYLEAGEFVTTHGIAGELRLHPWADDADFLTAFSRFYLSPEGGAPVAVQSVRPHKNVCIVKLAGVDSIADARRFIGRVAYIAREDAPLANGRVFVQDLLGARVQDADSGEVYGAIENITHPGRHDVYEVRRPDGTTSLFPATEPFLVALDAAAGLVLVRPIPGMFDAPETDAAPPRSKRKAP